MKNKLNTLLHSKTTILLILTPLVVFFSVMVFSQNAVFAEPQKQTEPPPPVDVVPVGNDECLSCHQIPGMLLPLASGEQLNLTVDVEAFYTSVHGRQGYACVQCHTNITGFPHPEFTTKTRREVSVQLTQGACMVCHSGQTDLYTQGRHGRELTKGSLTTALCVDCHTSHQVKEIRGSKVEIAKTCQKCHAEIYDIYRDSVHGAALMEESNFDVPTCSDCHENHNNTGPGDPGFILFSPKICRDCHADEELMSKYDINADVYDTYVADFHGSTVLIFENIAPDQETNKPVCIDCHGVHDIRSPEDLHSSVMKDNLLDTCQRCHPEATSDFSDAWLSHYNISDFENNTLVYLVNLFYKIVIPGIIGGILLFIGTDIWRKIKKKREEKEGEIK